MDPPFTTFLDFRKRNTPRHKIEKLRAPLHFKIFCCISHNTIVSIILALAGKKFRPENPNYSDLKYIKLWNTAVCMATAHNQKTMNVQITEVATSVVPHNCNNWLNRYAWQAVQTKSSLVRLFMWTGFTGLKSPALLIIATPWAFLPPGWKPLGYMLCDAV